MSSNLIPIYVLDIDDETWQPAQLQKEYIKFVCHICSNVIMLERTIKNFSRKCTSPSCTTSLGMSLVTFIKSDMEALYKNPVNEIKKFKIKNPTKPIEMSELFAQQNEG